MMPRRHVHTESLSARYVKARWPESGQMSIYRPYHLDALANAVIDSAVVWAKTGQGAQLTEALGALDIALSNLDV